MSNYRLGIDIGGTFTDFVLLGEAGGQPRFGKTLTTPQDPTQAILDGMDQVLRQAGLKPADLSAIVHGTTLVTNAVIERKGAKTGLLTTSGFEDILEIGREMRYDIYDLNIAIPSPLVPRNLRYGIKERIDAKGNIIAPLSNQDLDHAIHQFKQEGVTAVAICFLNAFLNDSHENAARAYLKKHFPECYVSLSSEIMPEIREYERASATTMNAYVQPITETYLSRLKGRLADAGFDGHLHIMISSGQLTTIDGAIAAPVHLLESGPAGGCMASAFFGKHLEEAELLTFDMGGTTAKASLIHDQSPDITNQFEAGRVRRFRKGSGLPVRIPVIDMIEIGAGGGSIAHVDHLGLLKVGPESAGSEPGPACYGRGGSKPTVTDADLVLGFLDPDFFLGGSMSLDLGAAKQAIKTHVADPLGLSVEEAAWGIHRIVNENMAGAARVHILEKGKDPRRYTMLAFGGAGPVHAFQVARRLGIRRLVVPQGAGVASSLGFLVSPMATSKTRSYLADLEACDWDHVNQCLAEMETQARDFLSSAGVSLSETHLKRYTEMRYRGQGHDIPVPMPAGKLGPQHQAIIRENFERVYRERYGRILEGLPLQTVTWRLVLEGPTPKLTPGAEQLAQDVAPLKGHRQVYFRNPADFGADQSPVYSRYLMNTQHTIPGPTVIEERESTVIVGHGAKVTTDAFRNLIIDLEAS